MADSRTQEQPSPSTGHKKHYTFFGDHSKDKHIKEKILEWVTKHLQIQADQLLAEHPKFYKDAAFTHKLLFQYILCGKKRKAEEILKKYPKLIFRTCTVTDYSLRTFTDINIFRYLLWSRDTAMLAMVVFHLNLLKRGLSYARQQCSVHEKMGISYTQLINGKATTVENEQHFLFDELIEAMTHYAKMRQYQTYEECEEYWISMVGGAQCNVPVYIAEMYCDSEIDAHHLQYYCWLTDSLIHWYPLEYSGIGIDHAIFCSGGKSETRGWATKGITAHQAHLELSNFKKLDETKNNDLLHITHYISDPHTYPLPQHLQHPSAYTMSETNPIYRSSSCHF